MNAKKGRLEHVMSAMSSRLTLAVQNISGILPALWRGGACVRDLSPTSKVEGQRSFGWQAGFHRDPLFPSFHYMQRRGAR